MRKKTQAKKQVAKSSKVKSGETPYELYRTLPNPLFAQAAPRPKQAYGLPEGRTPRWKQVLKGLVIIFIVLVIGTGGWLGYKFLRDFGWQNITGLFDHIKLKGEDVGRVNILLVGYSADDPHHAGAQLTDSIMLVSIDTKTNRAFMLSIPRDLYVNIPGRGYAKINEAYEDGQAQRFDVSGYPTGGMGLLEQIVSEKFNVPINYYALIDYTAFRDAVNAVGGITINIQSPDLSGLYDPNTHINLPNGPVTLNGQTALNLARARGDGYGSYGFPRADFDRTAHQRQMLTALAAKATSAGVLANPIKLGDLFDAFGKNVKTDFHLNEAKRLYAIMKNIPQSRIASASLEGATFNGQKDINLVVGQFYYGEDVLVPAAGLDNYAQIDAYISQLEQRN